jgi:sugar phosphate isomerase/epimerase
MELGISSWSLPWAVGVPGYQRPPQPLNAVGLLEKAVDENIAVVQIADNLPLHELPGVELDRLREAACARGLTLEAGTRSLDPRHLVRYIAVARRIGARVLRTVLSGSFLGPEQMAAAEAGIREVLPELTREGVTLALENNEAFSAAEFADLIRRIGSPGVGICLDTANSLGRPETLETVVEQLAEDAVMLHAKDYDIQRVETRMGFSVVGRPAGEGRVNFDWVLAELRKRGRDQISVIVEHWPPYQGTIDATVRTEEEWLVRGLRFLRSKLPTITPEAVN